MIESTLARSLSGAATVPVFVVNVDAAGDLVLADLNPACERITGLCREDVIGKRPEDVAGPTRASAAALSEICRHCLQVGTILSQTERLELPAGARSFHTLLVPLPDAAGAIEGVVGVLCDVTEQEREIRDLQQSHDLLRAVIEAAPTAIIGLDLDGNVHTVWNPAAEKMLGWSAEEAIGHPLPSVPVESQEEFRRFRESIRNGLTLDGVEVRRQKRDGGPIDYSIYASPLHDEEGHITGNVAVLVDLSERRRSEEAMRRAEQDRLAHLRFLESMDQVNRAIQEAGDLDEMMSAVLDALLAIFSCDRAYLLTPCDPDASSWSVPMERTRPEYPGVLTLKLEMPMDTQVAETLRILLAADGPVGFGPGSAHPLPADVTERFGIASFLAMALYPKQGRPWQFGIHQCSHPRVWKQEEERLFQEIGRRLGDALTTWLAFHQVRDSEARLAEAQRIAHVGHWHYDIETGRITGSDETLRIFGMPPESGAISAEQLREMAHPQDRQMLVQAMDEAVRGEPRHEVVYRVVRPDGELRFVNARWQINGEDTGRPRHLFGTVQDITQRKLSEEAVHKSNERYCDLYENAPNANFSVGTDGVIRGCNRRAGELLGCRVEELVGRPVMELYADSADGVEKAAKALERFRAGETVRDEELQMQRADGHPVWISLTVDGVRDARGRIVESRSMAVDITERKRGEQMMRARLRLMQYADNHSLGELLQATLDEAEALTGSCIGFYHFLDTDQRTLTLQAWSTNTLQNMCTAEGRGLHYSVDEAGVWVDCVRERRPVIHNDYAALPHRKGTPEGHAPVHRELVVPVVRGDLIVAILGVGNKPFDYDEADMMTTAMLADLAWDIVERKRAEEVLRRSERIKSILNEIAGIFLTVPDDEMYEKVVTLIRQALKSKFGIFGFIDENGDLVIPSFSRDIWTECQVAGKSVVFAPAAWGESGWGRAIRERSTCCSDGPFHTPDGHLAIEHFLAVPIVYADTSIGLISVANAAQSYTEEDREILERIAAYISPILNARLERDRQEEKRREAEEALRMLSHAVEQSPASIIITDTSGTIEYVNPKFSQITGYACEEVIGKNPRILKSGETMADEFQRLWDTITRGGVWRGELANRKKSGEVYWESATISPVTDANGEIEHYVAVKEDISARKQVEMALGESEAKVRSILDNIGIGVALISPDLAILEMNRCMREWFPGVDPEQHPRCYRVLCEPPRDSPCSHCPVCLTVRDGQVHDATTELQRAGKVRSLRVLASPVLDAWGQVTAAIVMKEDITEQLSLESQLRQAQKMEAVGRLAGGVAHDFNNMLGVIIGYSDMALERMHPEDPLFPDLQEVRNAAIRSADLTGKLLAFSRKQTVAPKVLDLNEIVAGMLRMLQRLIGEDIDLVWQPGVQAWPVRVDPSQIDQIMANLCVNARDAIAGIGKITIETRNTVLDDTYCADHAEAVPGAYVELVVSDDGCGMDRETLSRVFEPFFTTKETGKGTGLGLATVYGIVKQNNGLINIYSEPGLGSTFKVFLPRYGRAGQEIRAERPAPELVSGDETILLVEDELAMLTLARQILEGLGYRVLAASTPREAIALARKEPGEIPLLLSDVIMPEMNGRDLAKKLLSIHPEMRCLFMSGYSGMIIAHHGMLEQGVAFIAKPFSPRSLATKVRQVLDGE